MSCKRLTQKKYMLRGSPPYKANTCKDKEMKGNDGMMYISKPDKNGTYKWSLKQVNKTRKVGEKEYKIHDNGNTPFTVYDDSKKKKVTVYRMDFNEESNKYIPGKKVLETSYKEIYVGKDPLKLTDGWHPSFVGNTILLRITKEKFIYIGDYIYSFELEKGDEAVLYNSTMGNSDVPYPFLVGKNNTYLLLTVNSKKGKELPGFISNEGLDLKKDPYVSLWFQEDPPEAKVLKVKIIEKRFF